MLDLIFAEPMALVRGAGVTLFITVVSSLAGTLLGTMLWSVSRGGIGLLMRPICDVLRIVPNLVIIFLVYYFPYVHFSLTPLSPLWSATLGLTIAQAAYTFDVVRTSWALIPAAQIDGMRSVGACRRTLVRTVYLPNLFRLSWAPHVALWIGNLKLSSLASVIGAPDLAYVARVTAANTFRLFEAWIAISIIYVILFLPLIFIGRRVERLAIFRQ